MQRRNKKFIISPVIIYISVIVFAGLVILKSTEHLFKTSDFFKIKSISVTGVEPNKVDLEAFKGINIFQVDLSKLSSELSDKYLSFYQISVSRGIPDELIVNFKQRIALAKVKLFNKFFLVDGYSTLMNLDQESINSYNLPVITGLETSISSIKLGKSQESKELNFSLDLINSTAGVSGLKEYRINKITAPSLDNVSVFFDPGMIEVKIGPENYKARLNILTLLLGKLKDKEGAVKYIDLRFKNPTVKMR